MEGTLNVLHMYWRTCAAITSYSLACDLCLELHLRTEADVLDLAKYINYSSAAAAIIIARYFWRFLPLPYGQPHMIEILRAAQGLIADILAVYISLALYKDSRQSIVQATLIKLDGAVNTLVIAYQAVVQQMYARYLLTVWLATFQDDWSWKTHNRRWWILWKFFGHSTPETSFEDHLVYKHRFMKWYKRLAKPFTMLKAGFGLFGKVDDLDRNPYS